MEVRRRSRPGVLSIMAAVLGVSACGDDGGVAAVDDDELVCSIPNSDIFDGGPDDILGRWMPFGETRWRGRGQRRRRSGRGKPSSSWRWVSD